jgi:hypothetical protein
MKPNGKAHLTAGEAFVKLPRHVLESTGWRSLGVNARRFIDFLMIEHLRQGGQRNGHLKAPHRQLIEFGISGGLVSSAIREAEASGLVGALRLSMRSPTRFRLNWLSENQKSATGSGGRAAPGSGGRSGKLPPQPVADRL